MVVCYCKEFGGEGEGAEGVSGGERGKKSRRWNPLVQMAMAGNFPGIVLSWTLSP